MRMRHSIPLRAVLTALAFLLGLPAVFAEVKVTAQVSPNPISTSHVAHLVLSVENGDPEQIPQVNLPSPLQAVGGMVTSRQFSFNNGAQSSVFQLTWPIASVKPGTFTIPAITVQVDGKPYTTQPLKLEVKEAAAIAPPSGPNHENGLAATDCILQLQVSKTEFYQGEVVPITATLYIPDEVHLRRTGLIEVEKTDFAIQRFPQMGEQSEAMLGRRHYISLTYNTTLSGLKPGKAKIGPAKMENLVDIPVGNRGGFPFGFTQMDQHKALSQAPEVTVTVLPLPEEGKPKGFGGAVGDFTMQAGTTSQEVNVGDPVSVDIVVSGQGNFDALTAPTLSDPAGWKVYPARRYSVDTSDPNTVDLLNRRIGFATMLVPEKVLPAVPPYEFSFFSPRTKKYETLRSDPIPLTIKAAEKVLPPMVTVATAAAAAPGPAAAPTNPPAPEPEISDIVAKLPAHPRWAMASVPLVHVPVFQGLNGLLLLGFLAFVGAHLQRLWSQRRASSGDQERRALLREVESSGLSEAEFYRRAARYVHRYGDAAALSEGLTEMLRRYEALNFAGATAGARAIDGATRARVLAMLKKLRPAAAASGGQSASVAVMLLLCLLPASAAHAAGPSAEERYQAAVKALEKGDYKGAQKQGEALVKEGAIAPEVFALVGNAVYRQKPQGDGDAAIWYQRAKLFPGLMPEVRQNMRHVEEKFHPFTFRNDGAESPALIITRNQWLFLAVAGAWLMIFGLGYLVLKGWGIALWWWVATMAVGGPLSWLAWGWAFPPAPALPAWWSLPVLILAVMLGLSGVIGLFIHLLVRTERWAAPCVLTLVGVVFVAAGGGCLVRRPTGDSLARLAFVKGGDATAHTAAAESSGQVIIVPTGSTVRRLDERGGWTYVEIPQHDESLFGWLPSKSLVAVWPYDPALLP